MRALEGSRSREKRRHNLPHLPSSFVGRGDDVAHVTALLADSRLVTLTGPGGMGKTRLAIQVGLSVVPRFPDGVWMVELSDMTDPTLLAETVAGVLPDAPPHPGQWSADDVVSELGDRTTLLVLDNCEHVVESCGHFVDALLRSCPGLSVLATSREPLGIVGEHRWSVGPLLLPVPLEVGVASVEASEAGQLFLQRAKASSPGFTLTEAVAPTVAEICARLDGMPLAIELAAARMASLSAADVLERLDDRFTLLTTTSRTVSPRHQTLEATLEWSHDQLSPPEAALLRRASVFADWTLEAAQSVCTGDDVPAAEVIDRLATLANKSLVVVEPADEGVRYRLLETVRVWARSKLEAAGETDAVAHRHASWCLDLAERAEVELSGSQPQVWLDRLRAEHANMRVALEWSRGRGENELGVRLATALATFWRVRGHIREGIDWLEWAVGASASTPTLVRAKVLREAGLWRGMLGDITSALPLVEESSALFAEAGDHDASICHCDSMFHMFTNPKQALPGLVRETDRCREAGDTNKVAHFVWAQGQAHFLLGELTEARRYFEESAELGRGEADGEAFRSGLFGVGKVAVLLGEPDAAEAAFEEARAKAEEIADPDELATALGLLGDLARARGDWERAEALLAESESLTTADVTRVGLARAAYFKGRLAEARSTDGDNGAGELFSRALSLVRGADGLGFHNARCLLGLGWAAQANGDHGGAAARYLEALATAQSRGDAEANAEALNRLSGLARLDGRLDEADTLARRGLELHQAVGDVVGIAASLESVAGLAVDGERWPVAARLLAAAQTVLDAAGYARSAGDQARFENDLDRVRTALGAEFDAAWAEGSSLSADDAVTYAMRGRGSRDRPASGWESLTPAERQVATLVGQGLTNPEVGRRLFVSPRTVGHHLAHVYQKLGIHSRGALIKELAAIDE